MSEEKKEKPVFTEEEWLNETDEILDLFYYEKDSAISTNEIIKEIEKGFAKKYKAFSRFKTDYPKTWKMCMDAISDEKLMGNIIFCNDYLKIPPIDTLLLYKIETDSIDTNFEDQEKQAIGALWGFVFKNIFKYSKQYKKASKVPGFRSATYFVFPKNAVIIKG